MRIGNVYELRVELKKMGSERPGRAVKEMRMERIVKHRMVPHGHENLHIGFCDDHGNQKPGHVPGRP